MKLTLVTVTLADCPDKQAAAKSRPPRRRRPGIADRASAALGERIGDVEIVDRDSSAQNDKALIFVGSVQLETRRH